MNSVKTNKTVQLLKAIVSSLNEAEMDEVSLKHLQAGILELKKASIACN